MFSASNFLFRHSKAAERVDFYFEGMTIPISINELNIWNKRLSEKNSKNLYKINSKSGLSVWLNILGFQSREALSDFLDAPLIKDRGMARQLLRSWVGRRMLDEFADLVVVDEDKKGTKIFNALDALLDKQEQVSLLDLLKEIPDKIIHFNADGWLTVFANWQAEIERQQKLVRDLKGLDIKSDSVNSSHENKVEISQPINEFREINVSHRDQAISLEIWRPLERNSLRKNWIVFMPGLGGDPSHFRWLAKSLSVNGWEVVVIDHPESNSRAMNALLEGNKAFPDSTELFDHRLADLKAVLLAKDQGVLQLNGDQLVLMGHSLGALNAFLVYGATPENNLSNRCEKVLDDLSFTNLSRLLQCQITDVSLPENIEINSLSAIVAINSFGKTLWQDDLSLQIDVPVFLTGGTFDLVTPAVTEQLGLLLSTTPNRFSRALIIEGASHFSPVRIDSNNKGSDLYKISDTLVGVDPSSVQSLLSKKIVGFLDNLEKEKEFPISVNAYSNNLDFHILDRSAVSEVLKN